MQELTDAIRSLANGKKAVEPDVVSVALFRIALNAVILPCAGDCSISSFVFRGGARRRSVGKMPSSWYSIKKESNRVWQLQGHLTGKAHRQDTADDHRSPPRQVLRAPGDPAGETEWFPTEPFYN